MSRLKWVKTTRPKSHPKIAECLKIILPLLALSLGNCSENCSGKRPHSSVPETEQEVSGAENTKEQATDNTAKKLTKQGYLHKQSGKNRAALALFEKAHQLLMAMPSPKPYDVASNLDDQASVHLRLGHYDKAQKLYQNAFNMLKQLDRSADPETKRNSHRLANGISSRLAYIEIFRQHNIQCKEPLDPGSSANDTGAAAALPYFPETEEMHNALGKLNPQIEGCLKSTPRPVMVRLLITGEGKTPLIKVAGEFNDSAAQNCIEKGIAAALSNSALLPKFAACYRVYNFPFKVGTDRINEEK